MTAYVGAAPGRAGHRPGTTFSISCSGVGSLRAAEFGETLSGNNGISSSGFVVTEIFVLRGSEIGSTNQ